MTKGKGSNGVGAWRLTGPPVFTTGLLLAVVIACSVGPEQQDNTPATSEESPTAPERRGSLPIVTLPDMSRANPAAQVQLRRGYDALQARLADPETSDSSLAEAFGEMGKLFTVAEYLDNAETSFANARTLAPRDIRWPYYLAHVSRLRNDPATASVLFQETLALEPDYVPALEWLGAMYLETGGADDAQAQFTKALSVDPDSVQALYGLGRISLERREYAEAVERFERALELAPEASSLEYPLALAYRGLGNVEQAEVHIARRGDGQLRRFDPFLDELGNVLQNVSAYEVRGAQALTSGDFETAIDDLRRALDLAPDNPLTRLNLGSALYLSGDAEGAIVQYEEALRFAPDLARAHYALGIIREIGTTPGGGDRGDRDDEAAIEHFLAAVRYEPTAVEMQLSLADSLRRTGRLQDSLPHYAEALRLNPAAAGAQFGYAMALVRLGRYVEARQWLEDGVERYPDQPGFRHALARLLAAAPVEGVRDGRRALLLLQPLMTVQNMAVSETMAMVMAELGDFNEATAWQRGAIAAAEQAGRGDLVPGFSENLALYGAGRPCRTPWRDDDPVFHPRPTG